MRTWIGITVFVAVLSTAALLGALAIGASPHVAVVTRLVVSCALLYLAHTRLLRLDPTRVGLAVGAATGVKLAVEPLLVTLLDEHAVLAPLIGDLAYGPLIAFVMLRTAPPRALAA